VAFQHRAFILIARDTPEARFTEYHLMHRRAAAAQADDAPPFDLPPLGAPYPASSLPALEAACWVRRHRPDRFPAFDLALYRGFFGATQDVSDAGVLAGIAADILGGDTAGLADALRAGSMRAAVLAEHREAVERWGIRGVPAVTVGDAPPIVGAVPYGNYRAAVLAALGEPLIDPSDLPAGRILQTGTAYFA
jgi:predicted DsbA family dithiol-disulfide isomerase